MRSLIPPYANAGTTTDPGGTLHTIYIIEIENIYENAAG